MLNSLLASDFTPISLEEMGKVRLMNRIDTKFVTSLSKIKELLALAAGDYFVQEIEGRFNMPYYTRYYDTPDVKMFYEHQRGKKNRQKIRVRIYEDSDVAPFLEIKNKNNKGRTKKKRVSMDEDDNIFSYCEFVDKNLNYPCISLNPMIENHFYRITLVNREMTERITIDTYLEFHNCVTDNFISFPHLGIIEWKRDGQSCKSGLERMLRDLKIHQSGFSKYCIGMAVTDPLLRQNNLKPKLRLINKINPFF